MRTWSSFAFLAVLAAACGPGNSFTGSVGGEGLTVKQSALVTGTDSQGNLVGLAILLSDQSDLCAQLVAGKQPTGSSLQMLLTSTGSTGALVPPTPGDYRVESTGGLQARVQLVRAVGTSTSTFAGKAGSVTLTTLRSGTDALASGSFDLTLGESLEKVTGGFSAPLCAGVPSTITAVLGGDPCNRKSKCTANPSATDAEKAACASAIAAGSKCAAEYKALLVCAQTKQRCTSENKTDSTSLTTDCKTEIDAYVKCASM